jgi:putative nucleotidyltransferase with HDIG domain
MTKLDKLEEAVKKLYAAKKPERAEWADWMANNHVFLVADRATDLANRFEANADLARAAALLHDIADCKMSRMDPGHENESLKMARELMIQSGYTEEEISLVVDDAIRYHSCYDGKSPESIEGKILATADSIAHLKTDFYVHAAWAFGKTKTLQELKEWVLKKIERDLNDKVFFDEVREELRPDYEIIKNLFSR